MKNITLLCCLIITPAMLTNPALAQIDSLWSSILELDDQTSITSISVADDGGIVVAGYSGSAFIARFSNEGEFEWTTSLDTISLQSVITTREGYNVGVGFPGWGSETIVYCFDRDGQLEWRSLFQRDSCWIWENSLLELENGDIMISGTIVRIINPFDGSFQANLFLLRVTADGDSIWSEIYEAEHNDWADSAILTSDGGIAIVGSYNYDDGSVQLVVRKLNSDFEVDWVVVYDQEFDTKCGIVQTDDGGFGILASGLGEGPGWGYDAGLLMKLDSSGEIVWQTLISDSAYFNTAGIVYCDDGSFAIAGTHDPFFGGSSNYYFVKMDASGRKLSESIFGGVNHDVCYAIAQTGEGDFILAGNSKSFVEESTLAGWLLKLSNRRNFVGGRPPISPPSSFSLSPAFPSPFNSSTFVSFQTPFTGRAKATLVDVNGREMWADWVPAIAGMESQIAIDGAGLSAGTYWLRFEQNGQAATTRLVLVK